MLVAILKLNWQYYDNSDEPYIITHNLNCHVFFCPDLLAYKNMSNAWTQKLLTNFAIMLGMKGKLLLLIISFNMHLPNNVSYLNR